MATLDEFAEIAALSNEQIEESLMPDESLSSTGIFGWPLMLARMIQQFYHSLDETRRKSLFKPQGLDMRALDREQSDLAMATFKNLDQNNELPEILEVKNSPDRWLVMHVIKETDAETGTPKATVGSPKTIMVCEDWLITWIERVRELP